MSSLLRNVFFTSIFALILVGCNAEKGPKEPEIADGTYRTDKVEQPNYREYHSKEMVYSEIQLKGDDVTYTAYRDDKVSIQKKGTYNRKKHYFELTKEGKPTPDKHVVVDIKDNSFMFQNGRQGLLMKKVQ